MAKRPIFLPTPHEYPFVSELSIEFTWHAGFAKSQAQKCIKSLHTAAAAMGIEPVLEISSKSAEPLGVELSAFNLMFHTKCQSMSVESAFQGSKVFQNDGPFQDLYKVSSRQAKTDQRLKNSGSIIGFRFYEKGFPTKPLTAFYDWLYISALIQNQTLADELEQYQAFTDIAFNPKRSWNCQARSAALFVSLRQMDVLELVADDVAYYLQFVTQTECIGDS